jgi:predicted nucleic acid-binding protein
VRASEIFTNCENGNNVIFLPSIVIAEALSIFDKKRISFDFKKLFAKVHSSENFIIIPLDYPVLQKWLN